MSVLTDPRPLLPDDRKTDHVRAKIAGYHSSIVDEVRTTVERDKVVVVGMATNVFVKRARKALTAAGIPHTYLEYGGYTSKWSQRLAIKLWSGFPTFPQVFVRGRLIGGNDDTQQALADGSLKQMLDG